MTTKETKVYKCDFCKRKMFVKHAMELHEKWCSSNPENFKACSGCGNLEETEVKYSIDGYFDGYNLKEGRTAKGFKCTKLDKLLYPTKVQRKGLVEKYPETFEGQEPMPKECEHFRCNLGF